MQKLQQQDEILIVAPARAINKLQIQSSLDWLESRGYRYVLGKHIFEKHENGYTYSGTPAQRLEDLQWALDHSTAKVVWFAAGGYGCVHLLDRLDWTKFRENPKWLCGYSDITAIHSAAYKMGFPSLHATVAKPIAGLRYAPKTFDSLLRIWQNGVQDFSIAAHDYNALGSVKAPILGGNLSLLYSLLGSEWNLGDAPFILFIEDWYENWYHLDRMLVALRMNSVWDNIKGLVVGSFTRMDVEEENVDFNSDFDPKSYTLIAEHFESKAIPKAFGLNAGHIGENSAFCLGKEVHMRVDKAGVRVSYN